MEAIYRLLTEVYVTASLECADNILIFAVLRQWLLQQKDSGTNVVFFGYNFFRKPVHIHMSMHSLLTEQKSG